MTLKVLDSTSTTSNYTVDFIRELPYTDFVGFINQWNVLPGAYVTLTKWATFSRMNEKSRLLQIACTSGFQSRELAIYTGCTAKGIDISAYAIKAAKYNKENYAKEYSLSYELANGHSFDDKQTYTHIAFGAGLRFFTAPEVALKQSLACLEDNGYILASPFYGISQIPEEVLSQCKKVFDITPTFEDYKHVMKLYKDLEIIYQDHNDLYLETDEELCHYCTVTIERAAKMNNITDGSVIQAMYDRLLSIRKASNMLRKYQKYSVLVLRYRKAVYPNRYVELF